MKGPPVGMKEVVLEVGDWCAKLDENSDKGMFGGGER